MTLNLADVFFQLALGTFILIFLGVIALTFSLGCLYSVRYGHLIGSKFGNYIKGKRES